MSRVIIIGGGITGLSAAWTLRQTPNPPEILLLEQSDRLGGSIQTEHFDGFMMEHGPDVFLTRKPEAVQLCRSLGLHPQQTNEEQCGVYLRRGNQLYPMPAGMSGMVPTRIWPLISTPLLSFLGKLRVLAELVVPQKTDEEDESIAGFFIRRFGQEAFSNIIEPLLGGVAGIQTDQLSLRALMPQLRKLESNYGSILLGVNQISSSESSSSLQSLPNGLSSLIAALEAKNKNSIRLKQKITAITKTDIGWSISLNEGSPLSSTYLILAVSAWNAAKVVSSFDPELAELLHSISYRSGTMVHLAYHQTHVPRPLNGYGHLVASSESDSVAACTWSAVKLAGRAPSDHQLFRLYFRGTEFSDSTILKKATNEMNQALGITASPLFTRIHRSQGGIPQYTLGHTDRIEKIREKMAAHSGLFLAGNYIDGIGIPDCIRSGTHAANQVLHLHKELI